MRQLKGEQVDVWILVASKAKELPDVLSTEETAHLAKLNSDSARENYSRTRNHLRWLLSDYLSQEPKKIRIAYGLQGKPSIRLPKTQIQFNLSHSKDVTLYAFSQCRVGIDIEKIEARNAADRIAARFFSKENLEILKTLSGKSKAAFFFKIWTASEAHVKGLGESAFGIEKARENIQFSKKEPNQLSIHKWKVLSLDLVSGYAAALAIEAESPEIKVLRV